MGSHTGLARLILEQAQAQAAQPTTAQPITVFVVAYERVTRSIRRSILLVQRLAEPQRVAAEHPARSRSSRDDPDGAPRHDPDEASLHGDRLDRIERLERLEDADSGPIADIIRSICHDLGLESMPDHHPWTRRTPEDVAILCARAVQTLIPAAPIQRRASAVHPLTAAGPVTARERSASRCR